MSEKSNSKNTTEANSKSLEELPDDLDFWDMDNDHLDIDTSSEELAEIEKILAEKNLEQPLKPMSENELVIEVPDEKDILSSLDLHKANKNLEELPDISHKNVDELLAGATADAMAEDIPISDEPQHKSSPIVSKPKKLISPVEKIATFVCYLLILCVLGYLINYASKQHDFDTAKKYESNVPAEGENASIEKIETWWSKPVSNNTKFGVILVPSATITLGADSTSGVIRSVFYSSEEGLNDNLKPKGDPFTLEFKDGKFTDSKTNQITIYGTDGFEELAHFIHYSGQDEERWTLEIKEAPSSTTAVNSFKPLANAPVEPIRK